jgi:hypothetical protein
MTFNPDKCAIPTVYCGNEEKLPKRKKGDNIYYISHGTQYECLRQGIGVGISIEQNKNLPKTSLRNIKYVGEKYDNNFHNKKINNINSLVTYVKTHTQKDIKTLLTEVLTKKNGDLDKRAYNSILLFLYNRGFNNIPECNKI